MISLGYNHLSHLPRSEEHVMPQVISVSVLDDVYRSLPYLVLFSPKSTELLQAWDALYLIEHDNVQMIKANSSLLAFMSR